MTVGWGDKGTPTYGAKAMNPTYSGIGVMAGMQCVGVHGCSPQPTRADDEFLNNWEEEVRDRWADVAGRTFFHSQPS